MAPSLSRILKPLPSPSTNSSMKTELLLGCGNRRDKILSQPEDPAWHNLTTLDIDPQSSPDVIWDLNSLPLPFATAQFDELHFYEVLEHLGRQGDWRAFFAEWNEYWRILKPGGYLYASVPAARSIWAWGDPGHTRIITQETLVFLSQRQYQEQVGNTPMSDYRHVYHGDFEVVFMETQGQETFFFALTAVGK